ncbi:UDP-Glycosyltransferase/glycogen phosphorylase [Trichodelitschia bisporula]|uniref:GDP-Man:Man(3)GlcNAc(2)-PP-Dol alpha-1,2-mannosyltransferase n=1 Tax=Trichodelitschia bisporula TaxID=703511 RepID=A0A6G1HT22_9PEZI|nr:UDP-Glycosyltransferase/glycogen phosphorylase [Trichodelitschia bisporula]
MAPALPLTLTLLAALLAAPTLLRYLARAVGWFIRRRSRERRALLLSSLPALTTSPRADSPQPSSTSENSQPSTTETSQPGSHSTWTGIIAFLHPFCAAGGGGERVLWAAVRATQDRYPRAVCVVYTGDHELSKEALISRVRDRFNITLNPSTLHFLYLSTRSYVLPSSYPHFTLLGQSLGSLILALDALILLVPDIFIDTMGYAFALRLSSLLFPSVPTAAYVHYPTISTDMLSSLSAPTTAPIGTHTGAGTGLRGTAKQLYWRLFATLYSHAGSGIDVVWANSSWTAAHMRSLWSPHRTHKPPITILYPPVAVSELEAAIPLDTPREPIVLYIAQFRPEKNHELVLRAFALFLSRWKVAHGYEEKNDEGSEPGTAADGMQVPHLQLIGSVRGPADERRAYRLWLIAHELSLRPHISFTTDAPWPAVLAALGRASVGVNGMWNEHFGIGVVEYQAAGLVSVVNASGGPKEDIVVNETGFHASSAEEYAEGFKKAFSMSDGDMAAMRRRARQSARRFSEEVFKERWVGEMEGLIAMQIARTGGRKA